MINLGLSRKEYKKFCKLLLSNHYLYIRVQLLDLSHNYIDDLSDRLVDGQVNVDADADVTRTLDMVLFDPRKSVSLSSNSPAKTALDVDRMLKVWYCIAPPDMSTWYNVPVFCGPITDMERNGTLISVVASGKESMLFASMWKTRTFKKGLTKTTVLKRILNLAGETKVSIPDLDERIPRNLSLGLESAPWPQGRSLAVGLKRQLFYDGRGVARLRLIPAKSVWKFNNNVLKTEPKIGYDMEDFHNAVMVVGAKPKGAKKRIRIRRVAGRSHPLSPFKFIRNGIPGYRPLVIKDDGIRSKSKARAVAKRELNAALIQSVDVQFDSLVIPHLEPLDCCQLDTPEFSMDFQLRKFTIPLVASGVSNIGTIKRAIPSRRPMSGGRRKKRNGR